MFPVFAIVAAPVFAVLVISAVVGDVGRGTSAAVEPGIAVHSSAPFSAIAPPPLDTPPLLVACRR